MGVLKVMATYGLIVLTGDKGDPGSRGLTHSQVMKGEKGNDGLQGPMGPKGEQGDILIFSHITLFSNTFTRTNWISW